MPTNSTCILSNIHTKALQEALLHNWRINVLNFIPDTICERHFNELSDLKVLPIELEEEQSCKGHPDH